MATCEFGRREHGRRVEFDTLAVVEENVARVAGLFLVDCHVYIVTDLFWFVKWHFDFCARKIQCCY